MKKWALKNKISQANINLAEKNLKDAQSVLNDFITWYANEYYTANKSYGIATSKTASPLKIYNTNPTPNSEIERILEIVNDSGQTVKIYGLGISGAELNLKNVGIGFMNSSLKINNKLITGNDIYQALLQFNNSVDKTPTQLVETGKNFVAITTSNMQAVAKQVAQLNNPGKEISSLNWTPTVMYDSNIGDDNAPTDTQMNIYQNGKLDFAEFNKWLNQENFFFGRETSFWNQHYNGSSTTTNLEAYTSSSTSPEFKKYLDSLTTLGYAGNGGIWSGLNSNTKIYGAGSVDGQHALAGAVLSLVDYNNFKNQTSQVFDYSFNPIPDYAVAPYNQKIQEIIGVGLEGPRGSNIFNYNVNPYFSLPKWSQSSFQNHEGKMGHHTQQAYWTKYMPKQEGKNQSGPGYVFVQGAFHEGWAVFVEWYANELHVYGSELDQTTRLPSNWLDANGFVPKIKDVNNPTQQEINAIKNFQAGAYWEAASGAANNTTTTKLTKDQDQAIAAVKIANMLQYYGYLNEAQLRNMRLAVDPVYHYNAPIQQQANSQTNTLGYGASIKEVRDYLQSNSGLGQGDIQSESYRYLNMPSQATGYMTGKVIFEEAFNAVKEQYETNNKNKLFLNDQTAVRKLFDLMLRNGEIPLQVLQDAIKIQYNLK